MTQRGFENQPTPTVEEQSDLDRLLQKQRSNPYEPVTFDDAWRLAEIVARSGMYNLGGSPEQAHIVLMAGRDLGLSQSQALQGISCIRGKAAPDARTLVAVCLNHPKVCEYFDPVEQTAERATWVTKRRGRPERRYTFTIEDALQAGLLTNKPDAAWTKWPGRMLSARAQAFLARDIYPDLTLGMYTAEEMASEFSAEVPRELESVAKWQAKASHDPVPPVAEPAIVPPAPTAPQVDNADNTANADMLDPIEPPGDSVDWRARMRAAESKAEATRIGKEAIAADPSVRAEAQAILKEKK